MRVHKAEVASSSQQSCLLPCEPPYLREALATHGVEADYVKTWQVVGKLRRRHGLS